MEVSREHSCGGEDLDGGGSCDNCKIGREVLPCCKMLMSKGTARTLLKMSLMLSEAEYFQPEEVGKSNACPKP